MKILLHICCGPCAVYSVKKLQSSGNVVEGFFYNPNIHPLSEYINRKESCSKLSEAIGLKISFYNDCRFEDFFRKITHVPESHVRKGVDERPSVQGFALRTDPEEESATGVKPRGSTFHENYQRCGLCWALRLNKTAEYASNNGFDSFTSTLLISPYQDHEEMKSIAIKAQEEHSITFFYEDFRPGFRESHRLSRQMGLYHQNYCGCIYSEREKFQKIDSRQQRTEAR